MTSSTKLEISVTSRHSSRNSCSFGYNSGRKETEMMKQTKSPIFHIAQELQFLIVRLSSFWADQAVTGALSREHFDSLGSQFNLVQNCYSLVGDQPRNTKHLSCFKTRHSLINNSCISCMMLLLFCCCRGSQRGNRGRESKLTYSQFSWHH